MENMPCKGYKSGKYFRYQYDRAIGGCSKTGNCNMSSKANLFGRMRKPGRIESILNSVRCPGQSGSYILSLVVNNNRIHLMEY